MSTRRLPWELRYRRGARLASELRRLAIEATHRHCTVRFEGPVNVGPGFRLMIPDHGTLIVGPGVDFRHGFACEISGDGRVTIGAGCTFTWDCVIQCSTSIDIGEGSIFGQDLMLVDGSHRFRDPSVPFLAQGYDFRPVSIGPGAVVMSKCTIAASLGERAVVAAHSLVLEDVPAFSLAGGTPARVLETFGPVA